MGWDYDKAKQKSEDNLWASYSDLFTMLSVVFLMMYVVTSLRSQTEGLVKLVENRKLVMEVQDLREQTKVYSTLKDNYLEQSATEEEKKTYEQLMNKLSLLQDEAKTEKRRLRSLAEENEQKEMALNQYQQIIRNIINANVMSKASIKRRDEKIEEKTQQLAQTSSELQNTSQRLQSTSQQLQKTSQALTESEKALQDKNQQLSQMQKEIEDKKKQIEANNNAIAAANAELEGKIRELRKQEKNSAKLQKKISALKTQAEGKIAELQAENGKAAEALKANAGKVAELEGALRESEKQAKEYKNYVNALKQEKEGIAKDLAKSKELLDAKKKLAQNIRNALAKAGVAGDVHPESGDVLITFGSEYFDTDKSVLKPGMVKVIEKFFPAYSKALFSDPNVAKKIESVEIVGYSSPTFGGKYVDPQSLTEKDRVAVNYNLDLSYHRARSIFRYITDKSKMDFPHQKQLLPTIKVTGRSYLSEGVVGRDLKSGISQAEFCKKFDCRKQQRVIIKFDLKE